MPKLKGKNALITAGTTGIGTVLGEESVRRQLTAAVVQKIRGVNPTLELIYHDLVAPVCQ